MFKFSFGVTSLNQIPNTNNLPEIAILGKSNVGKSSLINAISNNKKTAQTSRKPGCTRQINFFSFQKKIVVDLPGYGYAKLPHLERENLSSLIEEYLFTRQNLEKVLLLLDIRHLITKTDTFILNSLCEINVPFQVVLTKIDKLNDKEIKEQLLTMETELKLFKNLSHYNIILSSSIKKIGVKEILNSLS